jgi:hypothetical protein
MTEVYARAFANELHPLHQVACAVCEYDEQEAAHALGAELRVFHAPEFRQYGSTLQSLFAACYFWRGYMPQAFGLLLTSGVSLHDKAAWHAFATLVRSIMMWLAPEDTCPDVHLNHVRVQSRDDTRPFAKTRSEGDAQVWCRQVLENVGRGKLASDVWVVVLHVFFFRVPLQELWDFSHFTRARTQDGMGIPGYDWGHDWSLLFAHMTPEVAEAVRHFDRFFLQLQQVAPASAYIVPKSVQRTSAQPARSRICTPKPYDMLLQFPYNQLQLEVVSDPTEQYVGGEDEPRDVATFVTKRQFRRLAKWAPSDDALASMDVYAFALLCETPELLARLAAHTMQEYGVPPFVLSFMLQAHDAEGTCETTVYDPYDDAVEGYVYHHALPLVSNGVLECWWLAAFWDHFLHPLDDERLRHVWERRGALEAQAMQRFGVQVDGACAYMFASELRLNETDRRGQVRQLLEGKVSDTQELTFSFRVCLRVHPKIRQHMDREDVEDPLIEVYENLECDSAHQFELKSNLAQ